jgi:hypothetical protein
MSVHAAHRFTDTRIAALADHLARVFDRARNDPPDGRDAHRILLELDAAATVPTSPDPESAAADLTDDQLTSAIEDHNDRADTLRAALTLLDDDREALIVERSRRKLRDALPSDTTSAEFTVRRAGERVDLQLKQITDHAGSVTAAHRLGDLTAVNIIADDLVEHTTIADSLDDKLGAPTSVILTITDD